MSFKVRPLVLLASLAGLAGCSEVRGEDVFRLGFLPAERAAEFTVRADELAAALAERMGMRVEISIPTAYEPLIEALRFGNLDAAFMDAAPAWIAHRRAGAEVVLAEVRPDGRTFYWATGFTRADSEIEGLADLPGKRLAHTSWTGSSGFVMPIGRMIQEGVLPVEGNGFQDLHRAMDRTFAGYTMAGGYKAAMELLAGGHVDAAFGADDAPERFLEPTDRARVREFVRLGRVPSHPVMVAAHLSAGRREAFVAAMLALSEERPDLFRRLYGVEGVVRADTEGHLGDFGAAVAALPGLHGQLLGAGR